MAARGARVVRRRMVRWFAPRQLIATGTKVLLSSIFGTYADKRELEAALDPEYDFVDLSQGSEMWVDYVADTGDGFDSTYSIAWLLSREELEISGIDTRRGDLLVMGGDQVYPAASRVDYEDRLVGPYRAALPSTPEGHSPNLLAVPGNHDWYDGLTNFLRFFCSEAWIGGWRTRQRRSYFAVKLPHEWWLWGTDIQFDTYIDKPQMEFFARMASQAGSQARVILCTAVPSWAHPESSETWRNLSYFREKMGELTEAHIALSLAGDWHHYARYQVVPGGEHLVTAGGGGAFLYPTHHLPSSAKPDSSGSQAELRTIFPDAQTSRTWSWRVLLLPFRNPSFVPWGGVWYGLFELTSRPFQAVDISASLAHSFRSVLFWALLLSSWRVLLGFARKAGRLAPLLATGHLFVHLFGAGGVAWLIVVLRDVIGVHGFLAALMFWFVNLSIGGVLAGFLLGAYLLFSNLLFGIHDNETFSAQHSEAFKNFVRLHIGADGGLTMFSVGIKDCCNRWEDGTTSALDPAEELRPFLIEAPVSISD